MGNLRMLIRVTMVLGVLSLVAGVLGHLALVDIHHGDGDVTMEWNVLSAGALVFVVFIGMTLYTLARVTKVLK